MIAWSNK